MSDVKKMSYERRVETITDKTVALMHALYGVKRGNEEDLEMAKVLLMELREVAVDLATEIEFMELERKSEENRKVEVMSFMLR